MRWPPDDPANARSDTPNRVSGTLRIVVLADDAAMSEEDFETALAHEIAHLELGHPPADLLPDVVGNENAAAEKVREWGFSGFGSLPFNERPS